MQLSVPEASLATHPVWLWMMWMGVLVEKGLEQVRRVAPLLAVLRQKLALHRGT